MIKLLDQLRLFHGGQLAHVVLTHNLPEPRAVANCAGWPFRLTELFNPQPVGFGANHNRAFEFCQSGFFCVMNPDVEVHDARLWQALLACTGQARVGIAYPTLINPDGSRQENEREAVTPLALWRRHMLRSPQRRVDWVSAAFWLVAAQAWRDVGGFDERFFMYCEDVDFCVRLRLAGWRLARADASVFHAASWASRQPGRHLAWHLRSLLRLWAKPHFWRFVKARQ